jgi:2-phosphosulfolactate phosphatase
MKIKQATLETCSTAIGAVVVIDVIRAFTCAAYAFAAGARDIILTGTVDEALALGRQMPGSLLMGELDGLPIADFDFGNSPTELIGQDLAGRRLIQRTSAGTQGIVRSQCTGHLLAASLVCAGATARYLQRLAPDSVTFVITGINADRDGDEDAACADYIAALLRNGSYPVEDGNQPNPAPFLRRVYESTTGRMFGDPTHPEFSVADLERCAEIDRFNFAMPVERRDGLLVMKAVRV